MTLKLPLKARKQVFYHLSFFAECGEKIKFSAIIAQIRAQEDLPQGSNFDFNNSPWPEYQDGAAMKILLVYPEFPDTFWSFKHALKFHP